MQNKTFYISFLCMVVALVAVQSIRPGARVEVVERNLDRFPYAIGDMVGTNISMEDSVIRELDTDVCVFRKYTDQKGSEVTLYIGYYGTKKGGRTGHNPLACYPSVGWNVQYVGKVEIPVVLNGEERMIEVNRLQPKKGAVTALVYHWYQSNGDEVLSTGIQQNLHRFKSRILYNRNDGAFVRVSSPADQDLSITRERLRDFIREVFPLIVQYWPLEMAV